MYFFSSFFETLDPGSLESGSTTLSKSNYGSILSVHACPDPYSYLEVATLSNKKF
jgi:hypothetical protein